MGVASVQRPGELIHLDTKKLGRIAGIGHRISDGDHSRRGLFCLDHMAGRASFSCEGMARRDFAVLRLGVEGHYGQNSADRRSMPNSVSAHRHRPRRPI
jgi:hypothetical protein